LEASAVVAQQAALDEDVAGAGVALGEGGADQEKVVVVAEGIGAGLVGA